MYNKIISLILIIAFSCQGILWAEPDIISCLRPLPLAEKKAQAKKRAAADVSASLSSASSFRARKEFNRLKANFGFLPQESQIVQYLNRLMRERIYPDLDPADVPRIEVLASKGDGVNAHAFPNRTIVISPELLDFIRYEEELLFVLCHEMTHMDMDHFSRIEDAKKRNSIRELYGILRLAEVQADGKPMLMMEERKIKVSGILQFFKRLRAAGVTWGPVHGTETDRLLNAETILYFKDMDDEALTDELTALPAEFSKQVKEVLRQEGNRVARILGEDNDFETVRNRLASTADIYLIQEAVGELCGKIIANTKIVNRSGAGIDSRLVGKLRDNRALLAMLVHRTTEIIRSQAGKDLNFLNFAVLNVALGIPFFSEEALKRLDIPQLEEIRRDFAEGAAEPAGDELPRVLKKIKEHLFESDFFQKMDLAADIELYLPRFIRGVFDLMAEGGAYDDQHGKFDFAKYLNHASKFLAVAGDYAKRTGTGAMNLDKTWTHIVFRGIYRLSDQEDEVKRIPEYLEEINKHQGSFKVDIGYLNFLLENNNDGDNIDTVKMAPLLKTAGLTFEARQAKAAGRINELLVATVSWCDRYTQHELAAKENLGISLETAGATHIDFHNLMSGYNINEAALVLKEVREIRPDLLKTAFDNILDVFIEKVTHVDALNECSEVKDTMISLILFAHAFSETDGEYRKNVDSIINMLGQGSWELNYKFSDLEEIKRSVTDSGAAKERFKTSWISPETTANADSIAGFKLIAFNALLRQLKTAKGAEAFFSCLDDFLNKFPLITAEEINQLVHVPLDNRNEWISSREKIAGRGMALIGKARLKPGQYEQYDTKTLERIFTLSFFIRDIFVKNSVQGRVLPELLKRYPFDRGLEFLETAYVTQHPIGFLSGWQYMIEEKAETPSELDLLAKKIPAMFRLHEADALKHIGEAVGIDGFMEKIFKSNSTLLAALLRSSKDDSGLRDFLFEIWWRSYSDMVVPDKIQRTTQKELTKWANASPIDDAELRMEVQRPEDVGKRSWYTPLDSVVNLFYSMDEKGRYMLLRKLLMSENGVLRDLQSRQELLDEFIGDHVSFKKGEEEAKAVIEDGLAEFFNAAQDDQLYFALYPLLLGRIANPPENPKPWQQLSSFDDTFDGVMRRFDDRKGPAAPLVRTRMLNWIRGFRVRDRRSQDTTDKTLLSILPKTEPQGQIGAIGLIVEVAQKLGSNGVRFLQLLGQFVDLPEEYRSVFVNVYDNMQGQSRLTAYETIKRRCPAFAKTIRKFGKRIGGGSQMTAYEVYVDDGNGGLARRVVKVRNPNAEYFNRQSIALIEKVLTALSAKSKDPRYAQALLLLEDLKEWNDADLHDFTFIEDDKKFKSTNDGYSHDGFGIVIGVPQSYDVEEKPAEGVDRKESVRVLVEDFVEGRSVADFQRVKAATPKERMQRKQAVSLIARNYFDQIFLGGFSDPEKGMAMLESDEVSLVHSDVNPGNFKTGDYAGAMKDDILDRIAFIKLTKADRNMLVTIGMCQTAKERLAAFVEYLSEQPKNEKLKDKAEARRIMEDVIANMPEGATDLESTTLNMIIQLKMRGIKIPLKITLLIKNMNALKSLARDVGFESLEAALKFDPRTAAGPSARARPKRSRQVDESIVRPVAMAESQRGKTREMTSDDVNLLLQELKFELDPKLTNPGDRIVSIGKLEEALKYARESIQTRMASELLTGVLRNDPAGAVRLAAADCLGKMGRRYSIGPQAEAALLDILKGGGKMNGGIQAAKDMQFDDIREVAAVALGRLRYPSVGLKRDIPSMILVLSNTSDRIIQRAIVKALGNFCLAWQSDSECALMIWTCLASLAFIPKGDADIPYNLRHEARIQTLREMSRVFVTLSNTLTREFEWRARGSDGLLVRYNKLTNMYATMEALLLTGSNTNIPTIASRDEVLARVSAVYFRDCVRSWLSLVSKMDKAGLIANPRESLDSTKELILFNTFRRLVVLSPMLDQGIGGDPAVKIILLEILLKWSEPGSNYGFGLSKFLYDEDYRVRELGKDAVKKIGDPMEKIYLRTMKGSLLGARRAETEITSGI